MHSLRDVRSYSLTFGALLMAVKMVGTAGKKVGFFLWMVLRQSFRSKRGIMMISAPYSKAVSMATVMANTWKNGRAARKRS